MATKKYGSKGKRSMRNKRRVQPKQTTKPSKSFTQAVQKIIHKDVETKRTIFTSNVTAFNQSINSSGDCLRLLPDIQQGAGGGGSNGRIGNEIKIQSLKIRGVLTFALTQLADADTRIGVRMLILRTKAFQDWNTAAVAFNSSSGTGSYTRLLENGNSGFLGSVMDFNTPVNEEVFSVVADKRFYMSQSKVGSGGHTTDLINTTKFVNFEVPYCRNKKLRYDDNGTQPQNFQYYMLLGYSKLNGAIYDNATVTNLTFQYVSDLRYEDA